MTDGAGTVLFRPGRVHIEGRSAGGIRLPPPPQPPPPGGGKGGGRGQGSGGGRGTGKGKGVGLQGLAGLVQALGAVGASGAHGSSPSPDTGALVQLAVKTGDGTASTLDFTAIPGSFTHLLLELTARTDQAASVASVFVKFNNDSGASYDYLYCRGFNSAASVAQALADTNGLGLIEVAGGTATANYPGTALISLPFYAATTFFKAVQTANYGQGGTGASDLNVVLAGGAWRNTAAITRVTLTTAGNFVTGSKATLYGIS